MVVYIRTSKGWVDKSGKVVYAPTQAPVDIAYSEYEKKEKAALLQPATERYFVEGSSGLPVAEVSKGVYEKSTAVTESQVNDLYMQQLKREHPFQYASLKFQQANEKAANYLEQKFPKGYAALKQADLKLSTYGVKKEAEFRAEESQISSKNVERGKLYSAYSSSPILFMPRALIPAAFIFPEYRKVEYKKALVKGAGTGSGAIEMITEKPLSLAVYAGIAFTTSGIGAGISGTSIGTKIITSTPVKAAAITIGAAYLGSKAYESYTAPSYFRKGQVLGETITEVTTMAIAAKAGKITGTQLAKLGKSYIPPSETGVMFREDVTQPYTKKELLSLQGRNVPVTHTTSDPSFLLESREAVILPSESSQMSPFRAKVGADYMYWAAPEKSTGAAQAYLAFGGSTYGEPSLAFTPKGSPLVLVSQKQYISSIPKSIQAQPLPEMISWGKQYPGKVFPGFENIPGYSTEGQVVAIPYGTIRQTGADFYTIAGKSIFSEQIVRIKNVEILEGVGRAAPKINIDSLAYSRSVSSNIRAFSFPSKAYSGFSSSALKAFSYSAVSSTSLPVSEIISSFTSSGAGSSPPSFGSFPSSPGSSPGSMPSSPIYDFPSFPSSPSKSSVSSIISGSGFSSPFKITTTPPPFSFWLNFPSEIGGKGKKYKPYTEYQPSLIAKLFGISGKIPKEITGFELRPLRRRRRARRRRRR